jgi:hypothetical protein
LPPQQMVSNCIEIEIEIAWPEIKLAAPGILKEMVLSLLVVVAGASEFSSIHLFRVRDSRVAQEEQA